MNPLRDLLWSSSLLVGLALSLFLPSSGRAADVSLLGVLKSQSFIQDNPVGPRLSEDEYPLIFEAFVEPTGAGLVTAASLQRLPDGAPLNLETDGEEWGLEEEFDSKLALDTTFPAGDYRLSLETANDGPRTITLTLLGDAYPNPPRISNFTAAQSIESNQSFTLQWDPLQGGTTNDFIKVEIEQVGSNERVFETGEPGEGNALNGTHSSVKITAGTLSPGRLYHATLMFVNPINLDTETYPGATAVAGYSCESKITIRTAGLDAADTLPPSVSSSPDNFSGDVPVNSAISFVFSEPMDTTLDIPASITWSGVNGNNFTYLWNSRGDRLFAIPAGRLPLDTEISWILNPEGSDMGFGDPIGNKLPTTRGTFTTSVEDNFAEPDVASIYLVKGRAFHQNGATAEADGDSLLSLDVELTGYNTVTLATLSLPDGGVVTLEPDPWDTTLEFETVYAFEADLEAFFPNGAYSISLHTIHNGIRTIPLSLAADAYPNPSTLINLSAAQAIDPAEDFLLEWEPFQSGTVDDFIFVEIERRSDFSFDAVFSSPEPGETGALDGKAVSLTIPGFTLAPGRDYRTNMLLVKILSHDDTTYPGVLALSSFLSVTKVEMHTTGEIIRAKLEALGFDGNQFHLRLTGEKDVPYSVSTSTNLIHWSVMGQFRPDTPVPANPILMQMNLSFEASGAKRFYRAVEGFGGDNGDNGGGD